MEWLWRLQSIGLLSTLVGPWQARLCEPNAVPALCGGDLLVPWRLLMLPGEGCTICSCWHWLPQGASATLLAGKLGCELATLVCKVCGRLVQ